MWAGFNYYVSYLIMFSYFISDIKDSGHGWKIEFNIVPKATRFA